MRVLLVEDDLKLQRELTRAIDMLPGSAVVMTANASSAAIDWLRDNPTGWDLAIVDIFLKQGHGFEVLKKCTRTLPHQRAIMMSNYAREPIADYAMAAGADRFFDKSRDWDLLLEFCTEFEPRASLGDGGQPVLSRH
jgi:DNA-binding NarL/FixJ family response regulator